MTENLYNTVIENDYCIGCGACSFVNQDYKIEMDEYGMYKAKGKSLAENDPAMTVCPFSDASKDEDFHAEKDFPAVKQKNKYIGKYINNYVGYVNEGRFRETGSSGGFGKWILNELLQTDEVDYVIQVTGENEKGKLFNFEIFTKEDDILEGSKSAYYPVTLKEALTFIKENDGRYAITAVPCFSKAIRNIGLQDPEMANRIKYVVGVICGHLKSTGFAESLAWQLDVEPRNLGGIEFRGKIEGLKANDKGVYAITKDGKQSRTESSKILYGGNWGYGFFKYKACDYCDDVVGETTDVSVGDAWIEELMSDHRGNNVIIVRNQKIAEIITEAIKKDRLKFTEVKEDIVVKSQLGGINHRREGLTYRLHKKHKQKEWVPKKRVEPSDDLPAARKKVYTIREEIRDAAHVNFKEAKRLNDFNYFKKSMHPHIKKLDKPFLKRAELRIKKKLVKLLKFK